MLPKTIQGKFSVLALLAVAAVSALAFVAHIAAVNADNAATQLKRISVITQRHMEGDMMHDAIRGDVLSAMLAAQTQNSDAIAQAAGDLEEHYNSFKTNLSENQSEVLPEDIKTLFSDALLTLEAYYKAANIVITRAQAGHYYEDAYAGFKQKFEAMAETNEAISNQIGTWAEKEKTNLHDDAKRADRIALALSFIAVLSVIFIMVYARLKLFLPQKNLIQTMKHMSSGDYTVDIEGANRSDEVGQIANAMLVFKESGLERIRLETANKEAMRRAEEEKKRAMHDLAARFESKVQDIITSVASASTELFHTSESMNSVIANASQKAGSVSQASGEASHNVQTVAAAAEQMSASVKEIASQIIRASSAVSTAVNEAAQADQTSKHLEEATLRIGEIVELIQTIAGKINLLALNATIESARAGEAGKGFAVVASEVKQLANQTTRATEEIGSSIANIRDVSAQVIKALLAIKTSISSVEEISSVIASAISQQTSVTNEIAHSMSKAAVSTSRINEDIGGVNQATMEASASARQTLEAARMLSQQSESLSKEVGQFLGEVRAA